MYFDDLLLKFGEDFRARAKDVDANNTFVEDNLRALLAEGAYKALIPKDLGGGGQKYSDLCYFMKDLAKYCPSTALTLSMHQHLVAVQVFNHKQGKPVAELLRTVAAKDFVLVSTGGGDWLHSNGEAKKVDGGFRINCDKYFCSGAPLGTAAAMSCAYNEDGKDYVLHFSCPLSAEGVTIKNDWNAMGMRGTGSHTIGFENVFVPEEKIMLKRDRGQWHPVWEAVATYAMPIFMAPYAGVAERMVELAAKLSGGRTKKDHSQVGVLGKMANEMFVVNLALDHTIRNAGEFERAPNLESTNIALTGKTLIAQGGQRVAKYAMEAVGGFSYCKGSEMERLYRDIHAGEFHPMQAAKQEEASGHILLGGDPSMVR